jgi:hypothetical protein
MFNILDLFRNPEVPLEVALEKIGLSTERLLMVSGIDSPLRDKIEFPEAYEITARLKSRFVGEGLQIKGQVFTRYNLKKDSRGEHQPEKPETHQLDVIY